MAPPPQKKQLPSKESGLFKELLTLYETKQLKKGIKTADQILKKFTEHGETISMKGLILTHMGRREEGLELVKKGLRLDLTSHICWHVHGLIQKAERDYEGALKSYTQALRFDRENMTLLNDAANLQTQLRHYDALQDTRQTILRLRPTAMRKNWISYAVACHLNRDLVMARKVLEHYVSIIKNVPDYDFEHSEVMLYYVFILEELEEFSEALTVLDANAKSRVIIDRTAVMEMRARILTKLDNKSEAEEAWRALIERNSECYDYLREFFRTRGISLDDVSDENRASILQALDEFSETYTRATAPRRLALNVATGGDFVNRARSYLQHAMERGIPSLFSDTKGLYADSIKRQAIEDIAVELKNLFLSSSEKREPNGGGISPNDPSSAYLWTLHFLAQHYSYLKHHSMALSVVDEAISQAPTLPELHACKARVLKRAGDLYGALKYIEKARLLDPSDRFLNTKSAKYHLRANLPDEAEAILGVFTKKDAPSPSADLEDMQSLLALEEEAESFNRMGRLGPSLKKHLAIQKVFDEIYNDQYDFHFYSLRKFIVVSYIKFLRYEDELRLNPSFIKSVVEACRIYIRVHDKPELAAAPSRSDADKKAQKKAKKAAAKVQEEKKTTQQANEDKGIEPLAAKDDDCDGWKALATPEPLEHAWKLLKPLTFLPVDRIEFGIVLYDVAIRRRKYIQALKALLLAHKLNPDDPELHVRAVEFKQKLSSLPEPFKEPLASLIPSKLLTLVPDELSLETFNSHYLQKNSSSSEAVLASARVLHMLQAPRETVDNTVFEVLSLETHLDIKQASRVLDFLTEIQSARRDEFRMMCDERFELSTIFKTPEGLAALREYSLAHANGNTNGDQGKEGPAPSS